VPYNKFVGQEEAVKAQWAEVQSSCSGVAI
jgi:hypothetical protein